jgi:hypothetical protein
LANVNQILISYLVQTILALLGFCSFAILVGLRGPEGTDSRSSNPQEQMRPRCHYLILNAVVTDFHKSQCYFAIALQIAAIVTVRSGFASTSFTDQQFLLLISANGLVPVALTFYTIMTFGTKSWYVTMLTVITVALSSFVGGLTCQNFWRSDIAGEIIVTGGSWPAACGGIGPIGICPGRITPIQGIYALVVAMVLVNIIIISMALGKIFTSSPKISFAMTKYFPGRLSNQRRHSSSPATSLEPIHRRAIQFAGEYPIQTVLHSLATLTLLALTGIELYYLCFSLEYKYIDFAGWGFGQVVGLTIWVSVFAELAYLEFSKRTPSLA